jgi:acyl dehydratase
MRCPLGQRKETGVAINPGALLRRDFGVQVQAWEARDTILYALATGWCPDALDRDELCRVYEDGLLASPSMVTVLASPGFWAKEPDTGITWPSVLHGEQGFTLHARVPATGRVAGRLQVSEVEDRGAMGVFIHQERTLTDLATGELLATLTSVSIARADGGCGSTPPVTRTGLQPVPARAPDATVATPVPPTAALLYRLCGDTNPLHADPAVAREAGLGRPILHGLCTFGMACRAIVTCGLGAPHEALVSMRARFSKPVWPGDTLLTRVWHDEAMIRFETEALERGEIVLARGEAVLK